MTDVAQPQSTPLDGVTVGILGGTGDQGRGLAYRLARAGTSVVLGSRSADRAAAAAAELTSGEAAASGITGAGNRDCAEQSDVVIVAVPWEGHGDLLRELADALAGKLVVDCVNPLGFDKQGAYALDVPEGSAAQQAASLLPESRVTAAFHHVSAVLLLDRSLDTIDTDVMVLGDDREATDLVQALASSIAGVRGFYAGRLRNAHQVESLTANLISVNRRYKTHAGLRISGEGF